jgi:hypothetical protein
VSARHRLRTAGSRHAILVGLTCSIIASVAATATAASVQRTDIPACEELLTVRQAAVVMGERVAAIINRQVMGNTRVCAYYGGSTGATGAIGHSVGVNWGPYTDVRKRTPALANDFICPVDADACQALKNSVKLGSNSKSFAAIEKALDDVGKTRKLPAAAFAGNRAFLWLPSRALPQMDEGAWVFVYAAESKSMLQVLCTDTVAKAPDVTCAIAAAKEANSNT